MFLHSLYYFDSIVQKLRHKRDQGHALQQVKLLLPGNSASGEPDEHFIRSLKRYELAGVQVGEKYHTAQNLAEKFGG